LDTSPQKLRGLEKYAGDGWVFEQPSLMDEVTLDDYWSDSAIEKVSKVRGVVVWPAEGFVRLRRKLGNRECCCTKEDS